MQSINIYVDDTRVPAQSYEYTRNPIYLKKEWVVAKDYREFVALLEKVHIDGITIGSVSLDHDLHQDHYDVPCEVFDKFTADQLGMEETGLDCAKYLTEYLGKHNLPIPGITVHSMNPVGKKRIEEHIMDWMDSFTYPEGKELDESDLNPN